MSKYNVSLEDALAEADRVREKVSAMTPEERSALRDQLKASAGIRFASDESVAAASSRIMTEYAGTFKKLARH